MRKRLGDNPLQVSSEEESSNPFIHSEVSVKRVPIIEKPKEAKGQKFKAEVKIKKEEIREPTISYEEKKKLFEERRRQIRENYLKKKELWAKQGAK